ncbi:glycoside hydrolase family 127 protein [Microbacterium aquimaris]|uniref:glycoside hydrolase family 127 protein n=1 Tax=Microbacterium aquimaris TaxID=459816 RepID=UPI002AD52CA9|nr:beta-L-arabinofuranosidase domain-containing protein [Microbacterium aquimaris]MDZ8275268.1 glycoside hydrolase family 127 protein [Microbacterium aquimaris]
MSLRDDAKFRTPRPDEVEWTDGFWKERWDAVVEGMIPSQRKALSDPTNATYLGNFATAAHIGTGVRPRGVEWSDGDCYKYLEALTLVYARNGDQSLIDEVEHHVGIIARAQEPSGYISTYVQLSPDVKPWTDTHNHELYNMGHLLTAAATHKLVTGRDSFLEVAKRTADYLYRTFAHRPPELGHFGWNPSNIMGLVDLARVTGDERYIELAGIFVDMRGSQPGGTDQNQDAVPLRRETQAVGHAVTGPYLWAGAADVVAETGDEELLDAVKRVWNSATGKRMQITGGIGSHHHTGSSRQHLVWEAFGHDYDLPQARAYNETCANLALAMLGQRLYSLEGDAAYVDVVERVMYNSGLSGASLDGRRFCYTNPLRWYGRDQQLLSNDALERWETFTCYCCPVQVSRFFARVHEMFYGIGADAVAIHQFGSSTLSTNVAGGEFALRQSTAYPWNGDIEIAIEKAPAAELELRVRIPAWAADVEVEVNGERQTATPGTYWTTTRTWTAGDRVRVNLPMRVTPMSSHPKVEDTRNHVAVQRGPVVYALESFDVDGGNVDIENVYVSRDTEWTPGEALADLPVPTLSAKVWATEPFPSGGLYSPAGSTSDRQVDATLIPYFAWGNRGVSEMTVWLPTR